jgi:hypothetical protein
MVGQNPLARAHVPTCVAVAEQRSRSAELDEKKNHRHQESQIGQRRQKSSN